MTVRWCLKAGTGIQTGDVRITPEIRCLKWTVPRSPSSDDVAFYLRPPHDYEVQFLLGIRSSRKLAISNEHWRHVR